MCTFATASEAVDAVMANLSKGGAGVFAPLTAAQVGDTVTLMVERLEGRFRLSLPATVVRKVVQDDRGMYGLQFQPLPPEDEARLEQLLHQLLSGTGVGRRAHPRVTARFEVNCRSEGTFRGMVSDLSKGGLGLKSTRDVPVGSGLTMSFGLPGLDGLVEVSGEVVSNQPVDGGFRLGVQFAPLTPTEQAQVNRTLDMLLDIKVPDADAPEDE